MSGSMRDAIALVTGATRGVGLGIARELGAAGATVYVTGRSQRGRTTDDLPGTVEEAAEMVDEAGGRGIGVVCDHTRHTKVQALVRQIEAEQGRLDLLVNNVWGGYEAYDARLFELPAWEQPIWRWDKMFETGVRAHYVTTRATLSLLLESKRPVVINVSAGDRGRFLGDVQYDVAKAAVDRLAYALARRHRHEGLVALSVHPGFTLTERVEDALDAADLDEATRAAELAHTHSPRYVGRAVVALFTDPALEERSGGAYRVGDLGAEYGFTDIDGRVIEPFELPEDL